MSSAEDEKDRLHVWDLADHERPRLQRITGFGQAVQYALASIYQVALDLKQPQRFSDLPVPHTRVFRVAVSTVQCVDILFQAFVALANGEIKTYDLLCLRISPYIIPDLWAIYEEKSLAGRSSSLSAAGA